MGTFRRHLPTNTDIVSLHVALNRVWDAIEANTSGASQPSGTPLLGASVAPVAPSSTTLAGTSTSIPTAHNSLSGIQGGDLDNYYHLTSLEYTGTGTGIFVRTFSPALTGIPTAPTPAVDDNTASLATTAYFVGQRGSAAPLMDGVASIGVSQRWTPIDHIHPTDTSRQAALSGTGFVKISGTTISYDNSTYYLASNPSGYTSNLGTVTSVAALTLGTSGTDLSSTVATGTTTPVITLNVPTASASNRGALSSTDWSTFNGKQTAYTILSTLGGLANASGVLTNNGSGGLSWAAPGAATWGGITGSSAQASPSGGWSTAATFASTVDISGRLSAKNGAQISVWNSGNTTLHSIQNNGTMDFIVNSGTTALSLNASSGAATFASSVSMGALTTASATGLTVDTAGANPSTITMYGGSHGAASQRATFAFSDAGMNSLDISTVYAGDGDVIRLSAGGSLGLTLTRAGAVNNAAFTGSVTASTYTSTGNTYIVSGSSASYIQFYNNAWSRVNFQVADSGAAAFANTVSMGALTANVVNINVTPGNPGSNIALKMNDGANATANITFLNNWTVGSSEWLQFNVRNNSSVVGTALTLNADSSATFASSVSMGALTATTGAFSSTISASNFSGSSSGTNTGDQNLSGYAQLSGASFTGNVSIALGNILRLGGGTGSYYDHLEDTSDNYALLINVNPFSAGQVPVVSFMANNSSGNQKNRLKIFNMTGGSSGLGTPSGGGYLFTEGGALKYKGSSGTVTTLANA